MKLSHEAQNHLIHNTVYWIEKKMIMCGSGG